MRPTSSRALGGRYLPVAPKCRTSAAVGRHDGTAQPRLQGTIGWAFLGEREAPASRWARDTAVQEGPGACARALRRAARPAPASSAGAGIRRASSQRPSSRAPVALDARRNSVHRCTSSTSSICVGGPGQRREGAQEPAVGLVLPRHRALTAPPGATQRVEPAVVAGAGVGVRLDVAVVGQGVLGEHRPGQRGRGVGGGHLLGSAARRPGRRRRGPRAGASGGCRAGRSSRVPPGIRVVRLWCGWCGLVRRE